MKCGTLAAKELTDFFRESAKLEEENAKTHAKLAKQVVFICKNSNLLFNPALRGISSIGLDFILYYNIVFSSLPLAAAEHLARCW